MGVAAVLAGVGLTVAHSTAMAEPDPARVLAKCCVLLAIAVVAGTACAFTPPTWIRRAIPWLLAATVLLLIAVLIPGVGVKSGGARRWLRAAGVSVQPAELAKLCVPLAIAYRPVPSSRIATGRFGLGSVRRLCGVWPALLCAGLIAAEPDLSTAVTVLLGAAAAVWLRGWPLWPFAAGACAAIPAAAATFALRPYQWGRVTAFWDSLFDPASAPYQVRQGAVALGSGGLWGCGLGRGWQKLSFLPEADDDFALAAVGEELGLVGACGVLLLWVLLAWFGLRAVRFASPVRRAAAGALVVQLVGQALLNAGVVCGLLPPTGIPHPFLSRGGSSLVVTCAAVGLVLSLSRPPDSPRLSGEESGNSL
ncbi:FtsW/RodA/SpoVE family cell cycle protein [Alienimonas chondri]|uniref:Probable peptidoglycan glycosyltransferase FtsW n=1 Tax=Alienimonas chondri TaxID=2681879 RepID=A0ABX1V7D3_9PLAN|nr:FtsW/RodA/SpoVE family cell cycle protein [Alienimonas chondri]NNJ24144.1 putative peptidoglycan glycosyltransferase FtsW [Alienimonas chondri]